MELRLREARPDRKAFDPVEFPLYGLRAELMQAENRPSSCGQGLAGYGKRYTSVAHSLIRRSPLHARCEPFAGFLRAQAIAKDES